MTKLMFRGAGRPRARLGALAVVVVAFAAAPVAATAAVYTVSGNQVSSSDTEATMTGGLSGTWTTAVADYRYDEATGRLVAWGTESFTGCLDRQRNGCDRSDPYGTMTFKFKAWQQYDPQNGAFLTGACIHPVTGGSGGFSGASGIIAMKDTPQPDGSIRTGYVGVLTIPSGMTTTSTAGSGTRSLQAAAAPRVTCGGLRATRARDVRAAAAVRTLRFYIPRHMRENHSVSSGSEPVGTIVAGYRIDELVGRGGMGEVYRALDPSLERPVALKLLLPALADDEGFRKRLLRESRLAAGLDHPNVVPIYETGEEDGRLFIAMRFVAGTDLKALLSREGALAPPRAIAIAAQVADALDAAHRRGLVHRDVKPSNVLIDEQDGGEHAYLADFGLTQWAAESGPADGQGLGTIDYVSPEQIRGETLDGRADQYALGCLLFETLTGSLPYDRASDIAALYAHLEDPIPIASERNPDLPAEVDHVLERAMAKDPALRYSSCRELVDEMRTGLGLDTAPRTSRRVVITVAAVVAVIAATAAAIGVLATGGGPAETAAPLSSLVRIDPATNAVDASYPVPAHLASIAIGAGRVWAGSLRDGSLWRLEPRGGNVERFTTAGEPRDLTTLGEKLYVASDGETFNGGRVVRYVAATGMREAGVPVLACSVAAGDGVVWAAGCPFIDRLSTDNGRFRVLRAAQIPFQKPLTAESYRFPLRDIAIGEGALWVLGDSIDRRVWKVDEHTGHIMATTSLPFAPRSIAVGLGGVWITGSIEDVVGRLDPRTGRIVRLIPVGRGASGVAVGDGSVWIASGLDGVVSRLDPERDRIVASVHVDGIPREIAVGADGVWVTADGS